MLGQGSGTGSIEYTGQSWSISWIHEGIIGSLEDVFLAVDFPRSKGFGSGWLMR